MTSESRKSADNHDNNKDYHAWRMKFFDDYTRLSDRHKNEFMDELVTKSTIEQLHHLRNYLEKAMRYVDFIVCLPTELKDLIFSYLNLESLLACCQVSPTWNSYISSRDKLWISLCTKMGFNTNTFQQMRKTFAAEKVERPKQFCLRLKKLYCEMKSGNAFEIITLNNHTRRVTAVYIRNNMIVAASEDGTISIWKIDSLKLYHTVYFFDYLVTCIRLDDTFLMASTTVGTLHVWDMNNCWTRKDYGQHTEAVTCFEFDRPLNVFVSGSFDKTVRLWSFSTESMQRCLRSFDDWIVDVLLVKFQNDQLLFTLEKLKIQCWKFGHGSEFFSGIHLFFEIPLINCPIGLLTPRLHFNSGILYFIENRHVKHPNSIFCRHSLFEHRPQSVRTARAIPSAIKLLLAVGEKYICIVKPQADYPNTVVSDLKTGMEIAAWTIPYSKRIAPDCPQIAFGDQAWLNGLDGFCHKGTVMAVGLESGDICLINWKNK